MIAMRLTEMACPFKDHKTGLPRAPTIDELLDLEVDGHYDVPIDSLTDCRDLYELATGVKGVPQDKTQRLLILSVREKIMCWKLRHFGWISTADMCANNLTKPDAKDQSLNLLMDTGRWRTLQGGLIRRANKRRTTFTETDIEDMLQTMD